MSYRQELRWGLGGDLLRKIDLKWFCVSCEDGNDKKQEKKPWLEDGRTRERKNIFSGI